MLRERGVANNSRPGGPGTRKHAQRGTSARAHTDTQTRTGTQTHNREPVSHRPKPERARSPGTHTKRVKPHHTRIRAGKTTNGSLGPRARRQGVLPLLRVRPDIQVPVSLICRALRAAEPVGMPAHPPPREVPLLKLLGQSCRRKPKAALASAGPAVAADGSWALSAGVFIGGTTVQVVLTRASLPVRVKAGRGGESDCGGAVVTVVGAGGMEGEPGVCLAPRRGPR